MSLEDPIKKEENYDDNFRRRYLLKKFDANNPMGTDEERKYEETYFTNSEELKRLKKVESILVYEFVLEKLSAEEKNSFLNISWKGEFEEKIAEARALPVPELEKRLRELKEGK